ncbi:MAG: GDP-mannose 4,6-dehydratase [Nanoarchaeota archaeon]
MSLKNKSILVTGGAGFIGSHLVDRLIKEEPEKITVASNFFLGKPENLAEAQRNFPELKIIGCDVSDYEDIKDCIVDNKIDVVFNLAVIPLPTSLVRPEWTIRKNIEMTLNICKLLREDKFKTLIQFSSSEAVGGAKQVPMNENHPLDPETPYAASKAATDHIALSYHHTFGCEVSVVRPFNQYGPRQNAKKYAGIIPLVIGRMLKGEDVFIDGDGEQTRDFLYVTDTAEATIMINNNRVTLGKVINIASGKEITVNALIKKIAELLNYRKPFVYREARPGDVRRHVADISLARQLINWGPKVNFEEGLRRTAEWYKQHPEVFE